MKIRKALIRLISVSTLTLFLLSALPACLSDRQDFLTDEEKQWLQEHAPEIEILEGYEAPPNSFQDESGKQAGLLIDFAREIEKQLGVKFKRKNFATWKELMDYSRTGRNFLIVGIAETDERSDYLVFTNPFIKIPYVIVTQKISTINSIDHLEGKRICTVSGYAVNRYLEQYYPHLKPFPVSDNLEGLRAVSDGTYDAMIINQMYASYLVETEGLTRLRIAGKTEYLNRLHVAVSIKDRKLYSILDSAVDQITPKRRQELISKWIGLDSGDWRKAGYALLFTLGVFLIIILVTALWGKSLKNEVHKQTEEIYRIAENLKITLSSIADAVLSTDREGRLRMMNTEAERLCGIETEKALGKPVEEILSLKGPDGSPIPTDVFEWATATDDEAAFLNRAELSSFKGKIFPVSISSALLKDKKNRLTGAVIVLKDISRQLKYEEEIMTARKLESLGVLAGGIAHDFNNLLTGIFGFIELARVNVADNGPAARYLDKAILSLENSSRLTNQLLIFSKGGDPVRKELSLGPVLEENSKFCLHGSKVKLKMEISPDLDEVIADKGQIGQVISNLVINAQQAMPTGGTLTISAGNFSSDGNNYVRIIIRDTGTGIAEEDLNKIFDPYFTTKKQGNGLGLATTRSIINKHKGTIQVESKYGEGTEFIIILPSKKGMGPKKKYETQQTKTASKTDRNYNILVLDDEPFIREFLETMLTDHGYRVKCASEGSEALKIYREALTRNEKIDLVISDLTIPGELGGKETAAAIRAIDPDARLIIASGYSNDPVMANYKDYGFKGVVTKPFNAETLFRVINRALEEKS